MSAKFGPAGNPDAFHAAGYKASLEMPKWLEEIGLDHYEYQCGHGVAIKEAGAQSLKAEAQAHHISLSLHAPYYINPATVEEEKRIRALSHVENSILAAHAMGAERIVIHTGALAGQSREAALIRAKSFFKEALAILDRHHIDDIYLCPETMGKINQLGTFSEVMAICRLDDRLLPTIDFGHINAREQGSLNTRYDYEAFIEEMEHEIGREKSRIFHAHFSHIEYTKGGEKKHLTFEDKVFGPFFSPLAEVIAAKNLSPIIICESAGTQGVDALSMKKLYKDLMR